MAGLVEPRNAKRTRIGEDGNVASQMESGNELVEFSRLVELAQQISKLTESIFDLGASRKREFQSGSSTVYYDQLLETKEKDLKCLKQEQKMFFDRFQFKVKASRKLLFCLVDVFYPALVEAPVAVTDNVAAIIPSNVLPPRLTPSGGMKRSVKGHYLRVGAPGSDVYVFSFDKPIAANQANLQDHFFNPDQMTLNLDESPDVNVEVPCAKYDVPKMLLTKSDAIQLVLAQIRRSQSIVTDVVQSGSPDVVFSAICNNVESLLHSDDDSDHNTSFETDIEQLIPVENPPEIVLNMHLVTWVRKTYSECFNITSNECVLEAPKLTIHQTSKPDFTLVPKFTSSSAISVTIDIDDDPDEYDELVGIAGECKIKEGKVAETLANMVSVAGFLTYQALVQKKKF